MIVSVPVRDPVEVGLNFTLIVQLPPPAASEELQSLVCEKSPLTEMPEMFRAAVPKLASVTGVAELVVLVP